MGCQTKKTTNLDKLQGMDVANIIRHNKPGSHVIVEAVIRLPVVQRPYEKSQADAGERVGVTDVLA